ncbi:MAG: hypothetical protein R3D68_13895 [Hyphomicrobiaceae bacterium]
MAEPDARRGLPDEWPLVSETAGFEAVQDELGALGLGDGLPLVPPTAQRLAAMLAGLAEPERSLGFMPPLFGDLTIAAVAYNCVLAGCRPEELALVTTAAVACLEPEFNLLGIATTTGSAAIGMIVHGPQVQRLGINASINCLGPGTRANAAIGRALSLVLRNIGGARSESGDMATVGQPAKFGLCFGEGVEGDIPWLHARRGIGANEDAITVIGISGTAEILPAEGRDSPEAILETMAISMRAAFLTNGARKQPALPEHLFILPPELAGQIRAQGWDLARIQAYLLDASAHDGQPIAAGADDIVPVVTGGPGVKMAHLPLWGGGSRSVTTRLVNLC